VATKVVRKGKRRLRIAVAVVAAAAVLGGSGWALRRAQIRRGLAEERSRGLSAWRSGHYDEAATTLGDYVLRAQSDAEALEAYAESRLAAPMPGGENLKRAIGAYQRLLVVTPERGDLKLKLCDLELKAGALSQALDRSTEVLALSPGEARALRVRAIALERLHRGPEATTAAAAWVAGAPGELDPYIHWLNDLMSGPSGIAGATTEVAKLEAAHPGDPRFPLMRGMMMQAGGHIAESEQVYLNVAKVVSPDAKLAELTASQLQSVGRDDVAQALLAECLRRTGSSRVRLLLARHALESGDYASATARCGEAGEEGKAGEWKLIAVAADALSRRAAALKAGAQPPADVANATTGDAYWDTALAAILGNIPKDPTQLQDAVGRIQTLLVNADDSPYGWFALGAYMTALDDVERGTDALIRAANASRGWTAPLLSAAELAMSHGMREKARLAASMAVIRQPREVRGAAMLVRVIYSDVAKSGGPPPAELLDLVMAIQKAVPGEPSTALIEVDLLARAGRQADVRRQIRSIVENGTNVTEPILLGCASISRQYAIGLEDQCLARSEQRFGRTPKWYFVTAAGMNASGRAADGLKLMLEGQSKVKPEERPLLAELTARYAEVARLPGAAKLWKSAVDASPGNVQLVRMAAMAESLTKEPAIRDEIIERLKAIEGERGTGWRVARARTLLMMPDGGTKAAEDASQLLGEAVTRGAPSADVHMLLAQATIRLNNIPGAIAQVQAAVQITPEAARPRLLLAALLQDRRDYPAARKQIDAALAADPRPEVKSAAASLLSSQGDIQGALKLIQSLPDLDRGGELLLGELYERAGELERAGAVADRLLAQPDVQAVLLAARVAQAKGNTEEADRALGKLNTLGLTPSQQKLAQADYYARSNELPKALALVDEVTKQSPNEGGAWRLKVAIQMSAGDVDGAVKTAESGLTHIKDDRVLAGLVERQDAVRKLMQRGLAPLATEVALKGDDERLRHMSDAVLQIDALRVSQSVGTLKAAAQESPGSFAVQQTAARLLLDLGRTQDASRLASTLASVLPDSADAAALWVQVELARGGLTSEDLLQAVQAWRARLPETDPSAELLYCRITWRRGRPADALAMASERADKPGAAATAWRVLYGAIACSEGKSADFARRYEAWSRDDAGLRAAWKRAVTRDLDGPAVMQWINHFAQTEGTTTELAQMAHDAGARLGDSSLTAWSDARFAELSTKPGLPPQERLAVAVWAEGKGDLAGARSTYQSLATDARIGEGAKNNLAMVLLHEGNVSEALRIAADVAKAMPDVPDFQDTLAQVALQANAPNDALAAMEHATRAAPGEPAWRLRLAEAMLAAGRRDDARTQLDEVATQLSGRPQSMATYKAQLDALNKRLAQGGK
jgi:tetratricopeptide (TPR) repeat protein